MVIAQGNAITNVFVKSQYRLTNVKSTYVATKIHTKMRCRRYRSIRALPQRTTGEKSDDPVPRHKAFRKAKFILNFHYEGKFGFFVFIPKKIHLYSVGCRAPPLISLNFYKKLIGGKDVKNYRNSDYAINKYNKSIVYRFSNKVVKVSVEDYLKENPNRSEKDFEELKNISDTIYFEQDRAENAQTKKNVSISSLEETEQCATRPLEEEFAEKKDKLHAVNTAYNFLESGLMTGIQKRRFILHFINGMSLRQIADRERVYFTSVEESIESAVKKYKKYLKNIK